MGMRRRRSARRVGHRFVLPCCFGAVITLTRALLRSQVWPRTLHFVDIGRRTPFSCFATVAKGACRAGRRARWACALLCCDRHGGGA